jgi:hypothetical protein
MSFLRSVGALAKIQLVEFGVLKQKTKKKKNKKEQNPLYLT